MSSVALQHAWRWTRSERWPIRLLLVAALAFVHQQLPAQLVHDGANTTRQFNASGGFTFTNAIDPGVRLSLLSIAHPITPSLPFKSRIKTTI